jgi:hypothetical protein
MCAGRQQLTEPTEVGSLSLYDVSISNLDFFPSRKSTSPSALIPPDDNG